MRSHADVMHYALQPRKRLLRNGAAYALRMDTPNARLKHARIEAGYASGKEAAEAMGLPVSTYLGHENGHRGFPASRAPTYARKFKVSTDWLLYGKGEQLAPATEPSEDELAEMIESAQRELGLTVSVAGWSRAVASSLRTQLERYRVDRESHAMNLGSAPGKAAPLRRPTKQGVLG